MRRKPRFEAPESEGCRMVVKPEGKMIVKSKETGCLYEVIKIDLNRRKYYIDNHGCKEWWNWDRFKMFMEEKKNDEIEELKKRIDMLEDTVSSLGLKVLLCNGGSITYN